MLLANFNSLRPAADSFRRLAKLAAAFAVAALLSPVAMQDRAAAGDYDATYDATQVGAGGSAETEDSGRFVRLGMNKSAVIRLPAEARDVIVGNPNIVDAVMRTRKTAYLFARLPGQTNIFFLDDKGEQVMTIDLEVTLDMTALQKLIKRAMPGSKITVDTVNTNVILGGTAPSAAEAKMAMDLAEKFAGGGNYGSIVNAIKISGEDQVMLKVRVVEVQRDILKDFGIDLSAAVSIGSLAFDLSTNPFLAGGQFVSRFSKNGDRISSTVQALESDGLLRILAEPNLTAVSGESAKFHAGGEIAVCGSRDESGNCQTDYREFGVSLNFTPVVLDQGRISLKIATEVSELNTANTVAGIPGFSSRSAETTIELPSGGSMMLAGLIKDSVRQQINGTPWLKDLPVLGSLFRSRNYTANESELVIIVTPYLVGPLHESQLATPADNFNAPTDRQGNLFGRLNKVYGTPGKHPDGVYHGNIGFIVQ